MVIKVLLAILAFIVLQQAISRLIRKRFHFPAPAFIGPFLDSDFRRKFQPPDKILKRSGIKNGMNVLEVGCGSGAFITSTARAVGESGKVYGLDIQTKMLKQLRRKLSKNENNDIRNMVITSGSAYNLPYKDNIFDLAYMITVLPEIPDRNKALQEIKRVLKPGGVLAVSEFLPDPDYPWKSTTVRICSDAGFILDRISGNFWNYTARFTK
jgi:ubiquinone/menaquinone biosynthesis C-methylase UbiE